MNNANQIIRIMELCREINDADISTIFTQEFASVCGEYFELSIYVKSADPSEFTATYFMSTTEMFGHYATLDQMIALLECMCEPQGVAA